MASLACGPHERLASSSQPSTAMHFTHAIVRPPAATFADGLTASDLGPPDLASRAEAARGLLPDAGASRTLARQAPARPAFPDSTFVEDAAIVTSKGAILTRPGAPSRAGEVTAMGEALCRWFPELDRIIAPGTVDGGDVCEAGDHFFIGVSHRTNKEGAAQLADWLERQASGRA